MADDDRDHLRRRTPPAGVRAQIAPPIGQAWSEERPTPPPESMPEAIATVRRGQKQTQQVVQGTSDRVGELRTELVGRIGSLEVAVASTAGKVDGMDGKVDLLTDLVKTSLESQSEIRVTRTTAAIEVTKTEQVAAVEVRKTQEIALIDEAKDRRAQRRQLVLKVATIIGAAWGTISALWLAHGC